MITKPQLPPKAGYVEVLDSQGNHVYKKIETPETQKLDELTAQFALMSEYIATLEDALCEMDAANEARLATLGV